MRKPRESRPGGSRAAQTLRTNWGVFVRYPRFTLPHSGRSLETICSYSYFCGLKTHAPHSCTACVHQNMLLDGLQGTASIPPSARFILLLRDKLSKALVSVWPHSRHLCTAGVQASVIMRHLAQVWSRRLELWAVAQPEQRPPERVLPRSAAFIGAL